MELCEAHWRGQNAAAQGRTVKGQDRGAVGQHQERAPTRPVILPSTNCRLYYRLVGNTQQKPLGSDLQGLWNGSSVCADGEIGVELSLKEVRSDGTVLGSLRFFNLPDRNNVSEGEYTLQGRYFDKDRTLYLQPGVWIRQPPGYSMASFTFSFSPGDQTLAGRVSNVACSTISVKKAGVPASPISATPRPSG